MKINVNEHVKVTLTDAGKARVRDYLYKLGMRDEELNRAEKSMLAQETWALYELMQVFGQMLHMGATEIPFVDNAIEIVEEAEEYIDPAAVAAESWLMAAKMTHSGYQGEHDEGGAVFKIEGVPLSGPSVYDFGHGGQLTEKGISPQRTYAAFTAELLARWNRGPVSETE